METVKKWESLSRISAILQTLFPRCPTQELNHAIDTNAKNKFHHRPSEEALYQKTLCRLFSVLQGKRTRKSTFKGIIQWLLLLKPTYKKVYNTD